MATSRPTSAAEHIRTFGSVYPLGSDLLRLYALANATVTYASRVTRDAPPGSWVLHVRLPRRLGDHFGISRQFVVYCITVTDLQPRDVLRLRRLVEGAREAVESDLAMLVTCDPATEDKLGDWSADRVAGMIVIPLDRSRLSPLVTGAGRYTALSDLIGRSVSAYNLYDEREPVTGERFFGRAALLRDLDRKLAQGTGHVGVFGLRRIGKTSVLLELFDRLTLRSDVTPLFVDLESTSASAHAALRIGEHLTKAVAAGSSSSERAVRRTFNLPEMWDELPSTTVISRVGDSLRNSLTGGVLAGQRIVLFLDEAEVLLPNAGAPREHALELFRMLRGVAQETRALTLVLAGVNATPSESPFLGDDDNPLFGLLSVEYLGPLTAEDCGKMIRSVGRRMQVRWDFPPLSSLVAAVGAHPLLARIAASDVVTLNPQRPFRPNTQHVQAVVDDFARRNSSIFEQMVQSLRRYYPDEWEVLSIVAAGDIEFARELVEATPPLLNHLAGYGVIDEDEMKISSPVFERWLTLHRGAG